jgi:DNA ligase-1
MKCGAQGDPTRGVSLRFPRFLRSRDDKGADDATDADQVAEAYERQASTGGAGGPAGKKKRALSNEAYDDE